eukprot:362409-Chlamydomonas_euryale.AAC.1
MVLFAIIVIWRQEMWKFMRPEKRNSTGKCEVPGRACVQTPVCWRLSSRAHMRMCMGSHTP